MSNEKLVDFMKRVSPIRHEPLATKVAEEWASKFMDDFPWFDEAKTAEEKS